MFSCTGIFVLPVVIEILLTQENISPKKMIGFFCTFAFQTNIIAFLYFIRYFLWPKNPERWRHHQAHAVVYMIVIFLSWVTILGGKEDNIKEWLINYLLHYIQPIIVVTHWLVKERGHKWPKARVLLIYPTCYYFFLKVIERKVGYSLYPIIRGDMIKVVLCFCVIVNGVVYLNAKIVEKENKKKQEKRKEKIYDYLMRIYGYKDPSFDLEIKPSQ